MARPRTREAGSGAQRALLEELKAAARQVGFDVREEKLLREVGYRVRSGGCRLHDSDLILLDRDAPPAAQIDVLVEVLLAKPTDELFLTPATREFVDRVAARRGVAQEARE